MCGIAGVLYRSEPADGEEGRGRVAVVRRMAERLEHRGPDATRCAHSRDGRCHLGHTRLSIIDLETGDQPMSGEDGLVQVVFNGEIYNFVALRTRLERAGHTFRTRSDTEVLVHGYEEWGTDVFSQLEGMFAAAIWDDRTGRLVLGRDRAGQKPLFVYRDNERIGFASEIKALLELPNVDVRLNPEAVPLYLMYGYVPSPETFYQSVEKVPPAHWMEFGPRGEANKREYWSLDWTPQPRSVAEAKESVRETLTSAVERRLVADVPLGAFLSGGVDSTIIVGLMSQMMDRPVQTFSIGFANSPGYDETSFARLASRRFGTEHTEFVVDPTSIDALHDLVSVYDEPFGDSSAIPTRAVSQLTRAHVSVALTGDGGDELFAGYPRFMGQAVASRLPSWSVALGRGVSRLLPQAGHIRSPTRRFVRFMEAASLDEADRMLRWIGFFGAGLDTFLRPEVVSQSSHAERIRSFQEPLDRWSMQSPLTRALALNFETYLLDDLLVKSDRCGMSQSLELRSPFLDTAVMELAAGLSDSLRVRRGRLKWILRQSFADLLPPEIERRGKMGFGVPLPDWLRGTWASTVESTLLSPSARILQWVRREPLRDLVRDHMAGRRDNGHALWALLTLESWLNRYRYA